MEIEAYRSYRYKPSASEECQDVLHYLGIKYARVSGQKGSHSADVWVFDEDEKLFKEKILHNTIIGTYRKFSFGECYDMFGNKRGCYSVSYLNKYK